MSYLRLVRSGPAVQSQEKVCLEIFDREVDYLFVLLQRFGVRPAEMDDLLQEIFIVLHRHWPSLDTSRPIRPWLFGVTYRVVQAQRRRRQREVLQADVDSTETSSGPEDEFEARESLALLHAALDRVPASRRSVVVMHDLEGIAIADIAHRLAMTRIGVYTRLYKGRKELASAVRRMRRVRR